MHQMSVRRNGQEVCNQMNTFLVNRFDSEHELRKSRGCLYEIYDRNYVRKKVRTSGPEMRTSGPNGAKCQERTFLYNEFSK